MKTRQRDFHGSPPGFLVKIHKSFHKAPPEDFWFKAMDFHEIPWKDFAITLWILGENPHEKI